MGHTVELNQLLHFLFPRLNQLLHSPFPEIAYEEKLESKSDVARKTLHDAFKDNNPDMRGIDQIKDIEGGIDSFLNH